LHNVLIDIKDRLEKDLEDLVKLLEEQSKRHNTDSENQSSEATSTSGDMLTFSQVNTLLNTIHFACNLFQCRS
jgi:uncharacterized protein with von Willebrand factor type A (vWA) domain